MTKRFDNKFSSLILSLRTEDGHHLSFSVLFSYFSFISEFSTYLPWQLALLLHQELNSSTRVPRVPRVRNAGSLPQLSSSTATSTLLKRTSSCGGKDNNSVLVCSATHGPCTQHPATGYFYIGFYYRY